MMDSPDELKHKLPLTIGFVISLVIMASSVSWVIRGIYEEFRHQDLTDKDLKHSIEYVDSRIDKKHSQQSDRLILLEGRVGDLERLAQQIQIDNIETLQEIERQKR